MSMEGMLPNNSPLIWTTDKFQLRMLMNGNSHKGGHPPLRTFPGFCKTSLCTMVCLIFWEWWQISQVCTVQGLKVGRQGQIIDFQSPALVPPPRGDNRAFWLNLSPAEYICPVNIPDGTLLCSSVSDIIRKLQCGLPQLIMNSNLQNHGPKWTFS